MWMPAEQNMENYLYGSAVDIYTYQLARIIQWDNVYTMVMIPVLNW